MTETRKSTPRVSALERNPGFGETIEEKMAQRFHLINRIRSAEEVLRESVPKLSSLENDPDFALYLATTNTQTMNILELLKGVNGLPYAQVTAVLGFTGDKEIGFSYHIDLLTRAGLVRFEKDDKTMYLVQEQLDRIR